MITWVKKKTGTYKEEAQEDEPLLKDVGNSAEKNIGFIGGISLLLNNITGPAMVTMPLLFLHAGWLTPTLCLIAMSILGTLASGFLCEAAAIIPGNHHFEGRVEFSTLVSFFFGKKGLIVAQIFINISLQCANVASIIECAQVADEAIIKIFGRSCGLQIAPHFEFQCVHDANDSDSPFYASSFYLFTIGFLIMMVAVIPMGMLNLDDNIYIQIIADIFLAVVTVDFIVTFVMHGLDLSRVPVYKADGQPAILGFIMANYAFVTTVPSWCSEKKKDVSVNKSLWVATTSSTVVFFLLGYMGALSFSFPENGDVLSVINASPYANLFTKILVYLFPLMVLATTIPVFSIVVRYNLMQSNVPKIAANFLAVVLPWLIVIPFLTGDGLNDILNWGTLFFTSVANFIIPFVVYIQACRFKETPNNLNENQKKILHELKLVPAYFGSINEQHEDDSYKVIPNKYQYLHPKKVAGFCCVILTIGTVASIVFNIIAVA